MRHLLGRRHRQVAGWRWRRWRRLLHLDVDPEDGRGDLVPDERPQLVVELERLALELHERVGAAVATQADTTPEVVQLGQVVDPQLVDGAQQDQSLDHGPRLLAVARLALGEGRLGGLRAPRR